MISYLSLRLLQVVMLLVLTLGIAAPLWAITFEMSPPTEQINHLEIQLQLGTTGTETDYSDVTGSLEVDLGLQIVGGQPVVNELNIIGGPLAYSDIRYTFAFGLLDIDGTGMGGTLWTPAPPSLVVGDNFDASDHELVIDQGRFIVTGFLAPPPPDDDVDLSTRPVTGVSTGTGTIALVQSGVAAGQVTYQATLTLPMTFSDLVQDPDQGDPIELLMTVDGVLEATAEVTLFDADFDLDLDVDGDDLLIWQRGNGTIGTATRADGDANSDTNVNGIDLADWQGQFGASNANAHVTGAPVPEPATLGLFLVMGAMLARFVQRGVRTETQRRGDA